MRTPAPPVRAKEVYHRHNGDNPAPPVVWDEEDEEESPKGIIPQGTRQSYVDDDKEERKSCISASTYSNMGDLDQTLYSREVVDAIFQHIPMGVILITGWGTIRGFSKAASRMFMYSPGEVMGENIILITPPDVAVRHDYYLSRVRQRIASRLAIVLQQQESSIALDQLVMNESDLERVEQDISRVILFGGSKREVLGVDKTGGDFPLEISVSPLMMDQQIFFLGYIVDVRDITVFQDLTVKQELLLRSIVESTTVARLLDGQRLIKDLYPEVTIAVVDVAHFAEKSIVLGDSNLAFDWLMEMFSVLDKVVGTNAVMKAKTMGSTYVIATGMPNPNPQQCPLMVDVAIGMIRAIQQYSDNLAAGKSVDSLQHTKSRQKKKSAKFQTEAADTVGWRKYVLPVEIRVGIASGSCAAGMQGKLRNSYEVVGVPVITADALRQSGRPQSIQITSETIEKLPDALRQRFRKRRGVAIPGLGKRETFEMLPLANEEATED